jgi:3-deoxy-7-phosphoheptulonate synthase
MLERAERSRAGSAPEPPASALPTPWALRRRLPASARVRATVQRARSALRDLLHGRDRSRLLVIAGPCSIHDPSAALDYAQRLATLAGGLRGELVVAMRTFFEKPRTALGWKGLINDPRLDGSCDVAGGLALARSLLLDINALGIPCAAEILDPMTPPYLADLIAWGGIGARTSESPVHRQLASGLPFPVGFKNGLGGDIEGACNGIVAARGPHRFLGIGPSGRCDVVTTRGNPDLHIVLRGGESGPNHGATHRASAAERLAPQGIARPVLVDCSHGNSRKDPTRQAAVCRELLGTLPEAGPELLGLMLESQLVEGRQTLEPGRALRYGVSITDGCIGWDETADLLCEIADAVKRAR